MYKLLQGSGSSFSVQLLHCVFNCLTTTQEDGRLVASNLTPLSVELGGRLLDLAFQLGIEVSLKLFLVQLLFNKNIQFL